MFSGFPIIDLGGLSRFFESFLMSERPQDQAPMPRCTAWHWRAIAFAVRLALAVLVGSERAAKSETVH